MRIGTKVAAAWLGVLILGSPGWGQRFTGLGDDDCAPGSRDCNPCAHEVESQFRALSRLDPLRVTYNTRVGRPVRGWPAEWSEGLDPIIGNRGHIQGFARIAGFRDNDFFVMSRSNGDGRPAGLQFAEMRDLPGDGGAPFWFRAGRLDRYWVPNPPAGAVEPPASRSIRLFAHIPETKHPGGIQVVGRIIAVAAYCEGGDSEGCRVCIDEGGNEIECRESVVPARRAFVDFYEIGECAGNPELECCGGDPTSWCALPINRLYLTRGGLVAKNEKRAYYVAVARLDNGYYVVMVNRSNRGKFDIFLSSNTTIDTSTRWRDRSRRKYRANFDNGDDTYQNMSFVTECGSGRLFLLGFHREDGASFGGVVPRPFRRNAIDLFRARAESDGDVELERLGRLEVDLHGRACEMRGGANAYVTPQGQLVVYCSQTKNLPSKGEVTRLLTFSEFMAWRSIFVPVPLSPRPPVVFPVTP